MRWLSLLILAVSLPLSAANYYIWVAAESVDELTLMEFDGSALRVVRTVAVGTYPAEVEGPHGLNISPDGKYLYVSISHGKPYGAIHKLDALTGEWIDDVTVGMFPATMAVSPRTNLLYVVNFDLFGKMEPSSVSVVDTSSMTEVERIDTGIMPHGGRFGRDWRHFYQVNMMNDNLVEIDAHKFKVSRVLALETPPKNKVTHGGHGAHTGHGHGAHSNHGTHQGHGKQMKHDGHMGHGGHEGHGMGDSLMGPMKMVVQPTWVTEPTPSRNVYVAGNGVNTIFEVNLDKWMVTRAFENTGKAPYNLEVTSDGKLMIATYKQDKAVGFWDLASGKELARTATKRRVPHGVIRSPDDRFAFVSVEGIGGEPGTVEVFDLTTYKRVADAEMGLQAGGIIFWKMGAL